MHEIKTAPAEVSLIILIFILKLVSFSLQSLSIAVFIPSNDRTIIEQSNTRIHSFLEILKKMARSTIITKTPNCILKFRSFLKRKLMPWNANTKLLINEFITFL